MPGGISYSIYIQFIQVYNTLMFEHLTDNKMEVNTWFCIILSCLLFVYHDLKHYIVL